MFGWLAGWQWASYLSGYSKNYNWARLLDTVHVVKLKQLKSDITQ